MNKIIVIGISGAGKSTFALELAKKTAIPLYHLDLIHWQPGWIPLEKSKWRATQQNIIQQDRWIIDGNYGGTLELRMQNADTIFVFDFHSLIALWGALRRTWTYRGKTRPDLNPLCSEKFDLSFYKYILEFNRKHRTIIDQALEKYSKNKNVIHFKNRKEVENYLRIT